MALDENAILDRKVFPILDALTGCLPEELDRSNLPELSRMVIQTGDTIAADLLGPNCDSFGWVRAGLMVPSVNFPVRGGGTANSRGPFAFDIDVGILRCAPTLDRRARAISEERYRDSALLQWSDAAAIERAICACLKAADRDYVLTQYVPSGPQGGLVGGYWTATVRDRSLDS